MPPIQAPAGRSAPQPRQEGTVDAQIERALRRIRLLDVTAGLLGLFLLVLVYGVALILLDAKLEFPSLVRQIAFGVLVLGSLVYLGLIVYRPLMRPLDSRYVAVQVEQTLPTAKNSVINWIDLREQKLPAAIRGAVAGRAAKDMSQADIDRAISARHVFWLGGVAAVMFVSAVVVFAVMGPSKFFSLFHRAFSPFSETTIASRTVIEVVLPEGGNATVPVGQSVQFLVRVKGRVPKPEAGDATKLLFRYSETEPIYQERVLSQGDVPGEWVYRLPAVEVNTGFFYRIAGGDFVTPEYRVTVRSGPLLTKFDVKYQHRPYLRKFFKKDFETSDDPNLRGWRGTEVTLTAHTNRVVKEGRLLIDGGKEQPITVASEVAPESPDAMRFRFVLEKDGLYRIRFVSQEGEHSGDSVSYKITLMPDNPPAVEITDPAEDLVLVPMNSALPLHGKIKDDYGIVDAKLRMKVKGGAALQAKPYRNAGYRYEDGNPPTEHDYQDSIVVSELRGEKGDAVKFKDGDIVEYWLEATDSCDYPEGQVGKSKLKRFKVIPAAPDKQAEQEKKQAQDQNKKADQQNNEKRQQENQERKDQAKQGENKPPQPKDARNEEQKRKDEDAKKQKDDFEKEIDKKKGEDKPDQKQDKGENKDKGENAQPDKNKGENKPGEQKPDPKSGESKNDQGQNGPSKNEQGKNDKTGSESKTGQNDKGQNNQGKNNEGKNSQGNPDQKQGGGQGAGEKKPDPKPGNDKGAGEQHQPEHDPSGIGGNPSSKPGAAGNEPPKSGDKPKGSEHGGGGDQQPQGSKDAGQQKGGEKPKQQTGQSKGPGAVDKPGQGSEKKPGGAPQGNEKEGAAHPDSTESKPAANDGKPATGEARGDNQPGKGEHRGAPGDQPKGESHKSADGKDGPASPNAGTKAQQGEKKPATPAQTKGSGSDHPEKKPDEQAGNNGQGQQQGPRDPKNPTNDEMDRLAKDLHSKDPQKQVQADRDLQQIAKEAKDAKKREQAKQALKNAEGPGGGSPKQEDQAQKTPSTAAGKSGPDGKEDPSKTGGQGKADGKGGPDKEGKADGGGNPTDKKGDDQQTSKGSNGKGNEKGEPQDGNPTTGNDKGGQGGGATGDRADQRGGAGQEAAAATPADLANKKKAADLQLEQLMKKITPEMLKERNWTEDDLKRWQQSMKDLINRDYKREMEKLAPPRAGGSASLPNSFRKTDGSNNPAQDVQNIGKTAPPPEIRSAYQEFTQELSKDLAKKKK